MTVPSVNAIDAGPSHGSIRRRVVLVEGASRRAHALVVLPRLGNHHQHGVRQRPTRITSSSRTLSKIAVSLPPSRMIGRIFFRSSPSTSDCEQRLARLHPVDVAAQRVDLAVVSDKTVRMGQRPRRECVGAEALVHQGERRLEIRVRQIRGTSAPIWSAVSIPL